MYVSDGKKVFSVAEEQEQTNTTRTSKKPLKNHRGRILVYDTHGGRHWTSYKHVVESRDAEGKIDIDNLFLLSKENEPLSLSSGSMDGVEDVEEVNDVDDITEDKKGREWIESIEPIESIYARRIDNGENLSRKRGSYSYIVLFIVFAFFFWECTKLWSDRLAHLTTNIDRIPVKVSLPSLSDVCDAISHTKRSFLGSQHNSSYTF